MKVQVNVTRAQLTKFIAEGLKHEWPFAEGCKGESLRTVIIDPGEDLVGVEPEDIVLTVEVQKGD